MPPRKQAKKPTNAEKSPEISKKSPELSRKATPPTKRKRVLPESIQRSAKEIKKSAEELKRSAGEFKRSAKVLRQSLSQHLLPAPGSPPALSLPARSLPPASPPTKPAPVRKLFPKTVVPPGTLGRPLSPDISSDEESSSPSYSPKEAVSPRLFLLRTPRDGPYTPKEMPGTPASEEEIADKEIADKEIADMEMAYSIATDAPTDTVMAEKNTAISRPLTPTEVLSPSPCPSMSPRSLQREERLEEMKLALIKLDFDVTRRTAEYRRENGDYFEGDTPRTSQEEENNSEYRYSQNSVADVVELKPLVGFILDHVPLPEIFKSVGTAAGMDQEAASSDPPVFREALTALLGCEPRPCLELLEQAVRAAEREAEEARVRAMLRGALP